MIFKLNNLTKNIEKGERLVKKVNQNYNVNEINNNLMLKLLKLVVECDNFDKNEDKQRQCYETIEVFLA